jgi:hypothetical protein
MLTLFMTHRPAGLKENNFQTMDIDLLGGRSLFIVLRRQRTLTGGEAKDTNSGVMFLLQCIL